MKKVNLVDLYPSLYQQDTIIEVPDEVLEAIKEENKKEAARMRRMYRYNAQYSLDRGDAIESDALYPPLAPDTLFENDQMRRQLYSAVMQLPDKQAKRIYARYYLEMTTEEIARAENVDVSRIRDSIRRGLKNLREIIKNF